MHTVTADSISVCVHVCPHYAAVLVLHHCRCSGTADNSSSRCYSETTSSSRNQQQLLLSSDCLCTQQYQYQQQPLSVSSGNTSATSSSSSIAIAALVHVALNVRDVIPGVPVQRLFQALLVQIVADEANGPAQYKQAVETAVGNELISLLLCEGTAGA
jgi:hypothetical protein